MALLSHFDPDSPPLPPPLDAYPFPRIHTPITSVFGDAFQRPPTPTTPLSFHATTPSSQSRRLAPLDPNLTLTPALSVSPLSFLQSPGSLAVRRGMDLQTRDGGAGVGGVGRGEAGMAMQRRLGGYMGGAWRGSQTAPASPIAGPGDQIEPSAPISPAKPNWQPPSNLPPFQQNFANSFPQYPTAVPLAQLQNISRQHAQAQLNLRPQLHTGSLGFTSNPHWPAQPYPTPALPLDPAGYSYQPTPYSTFNPSYIVPPPLSTPTSLGQGFTYQTPSTTPLHHSFSSASGTTGAYDPSSDSALPSPAYSQASFYAFTPHSQTFDRPHTTAPPHGWERPLTIPGSALVPPATQRLQQMMQDESDERDRYRGGSHGASVTSASTDAEGEEEGEGVSVYADDQSVVNQFEESETRPGSSYSLVQEEDFQQGGEPAGDEEREPDEETGVTETPGEMRKEGVLYTNNADIKQTQFIKRHCHNCQARDAPSWRRSIIYEGFILCNKCGIYERTHKTSRPLNVHCGAQTREATKAAVLGTSGGGGYKSRPPKPLKLASRGKGSTPPSTGQTPRSATTSLVPSQVATPLSARFPSYRTHPQPKQQNLSVYSPYLPSEPDQRRDSLSTNTSDLQTPLTGTPTWSSTASLPMSAIIPSFPAPSYADPLPNSQSTSAPAITGYTRSASASTSGTHRVSPYSIYGRRSTVTHAYSGALRGSTLAAGGSGRGVGFMPSTGRVLRPSYADDALPGSADMSQGGSGSSLESSVIQTPGEVPSQVMALSPVEMGSEGQDGEVGQGGEWKGQTGLGLGVGLEMGAGEGVGSGMRRDEEYVASWMAGR